MLSFCGLQKSFQVSYTLLMDRDQKLSTVESAALLIGRDQKLSIAKHSGIVDG